MGVCFYDRRENPSNFSVERFCATSDNAATTWADWRVTETGFAPVPGQDDLVGVDYMDDYDTLASDFTRKSAGFFGAWGDNTAGNPDIRGASSSRWAD